MYSVTEYRGLIILIFEISAKIAVDQQQASNIPSVGNRLESRKQFSKDMSVNMILNYVSRDRKMKREQLRSRYGSNTECPHQN